MQAQSGIAGYDRTINNKICMTCTYLIGQVGTNNMLHILQFPQIPNNISFIRRVTKQSSPPTAWLEAEAAAAALASFPWHWPLFTCVPMPRIRCSRKHATVS